MMGRGYNLQRLSLSFSRFLVKVQPAVVVIGQACTTPWYCLSAAIENIQNVEDVSERQLLLSRWVANKKREYEYVGFAAAMVASTVTGSIQWPQLNRAHWFVYCLLYGSLVFSLVSVMIAFHLSILTSTFDTYSPTRDPLFDVLRKTEDGGWRHKMIVLFVLQAPIMLLSYSVISYLAGLALLVLSPLSHLSALMEDEKIALGFVVYVTFATLIYVIISLSVYSVFLRTISENPKNQSMVESGQRC